MTIRGHFWEVTDAEWEEQVNVNFRSPFVLAQHAPRRTQELRELIDPKPVYGMVRAIAPLVAAWRDASVSGINVYYFGLMTLPMLKAVGVALRGA